MKKLTFLLLIAISFWECTGIDMEMDKAKSTAEKAITLIGNEEFEKLTELYSTDFSASEPKDVRLEKFKKIIDATGPVISFELADSNMVSEIGEESRITLIYNVKHTNLNTVETYKIGKESGDYVIAGISIQMAD